jgi:hypothetical protein
VPSKKIVQQLIFMAIFILLQEAMPITEMFDLTLEAINIEAFEYVAIESNQHNVTES